MDLGKNFRLRMIDCTSLRSTAARGLFTIPWWSDSTFACSNPAEDIGCWRICACFELLVAMELKLFRCLLAPLVFFPIRDRHLDFGSFPLGAQGFCLGLLLSLRLARCFSGPMFQRVSTMSFTLVPDDSTLAFVMHASFMLTAHCTMDISIPLCCA